MRIHKIYIIFGLLLAFGMFFELVAHADEMNESTTISFSAPVQIPGKVLPAGTYVFEQADGNDLNLVRIFNADHSVLYATLQTVSTQRMDPTGETSITLAEAGNGNSDLLLKWFYPGRLIGHEFVYSNRQQEQIAQAARVTFLGNQQTPIPGSAGE
jgi:Protein of unknown function (DUF2911)